MNRGISLWYDMNGNIRHDYIIVNLLARSGCIYGITLIDMQLNVLRYTVVGISQ